MSFVVNRSTKNIYEDNPSLSQRFLYRTLFGRIILKFFIRPFVSKFVGFYMNLRISKMHIKHFAKKNHITLEDFVLEDVHSFNDFFSRKIKEGRRTINQNENVFISPCDSKLSIYKIQENSIFNIKDSYYSISDLISNEEIAKEYINGYCLIFRLGVCDYHRYCYIDEGNQEENTSIKGIFHTVHPISLERYNFFKKNHRVYTILHTKNFGDVLQVEVGAMMVGKIVNHKENNAFKRGEEKGYFKFGGSTIVLLVKDILTIDEDILYQSSLGNEITVLYGERIGVVK